MLYQLSYTHRVRSFPTGREKVYRVRGVLAHTFSRGRAGPYSEVSTCWAAIAFAVSESGPGCGTKIASR